MLNSVKIVILGGNAGSLPKLQPKPKTVLKVKDAQQQIWTALLQKYNC